MLAFGFWKHSSKRSTAAAPPRVTFPGSSYTNHTTIIRHQVLRAGEPLFPKQLPPRNTSATPLKLRSMSAEVARPDIGTACLPATFFLRWNLPVRWKEFPSTFQVTPCSDKLLAPAFANRSSYSDLWLVAEDGSKERAHKVVLAARSSVLRASLRALPATASELRVQVPNQHVLLQFLEFLYTDAVTTKCNSWRLLEVAVVYRLERLINLCEVGIAQHAALDYSLSKLLERLPELHQWGCVQLRDFFIARILAHWSEARALPELQQLPEPLYSGLMAAGTLQPPASTGDPDLDRETYKQHVAAVAALPLVTRQLGEALLQPVVTTLTGQKLLEAVQHLPCHVVQQPSSAPASAGSVTVAGSEAAALQPDSNHTSSGFKLETSPSMYAPSIPPNSLLVPVKVVAQAPAAAGQQLSGPLSTTLLQAALPHVHALLAHAFSSCRQGMNGQDAPASKAFAVNVENLQQDSATSAQQTTEQSSTKGMHILHLGTGIQSEQQLKHDSTTRQRQAVQYGRTDEQQLANVFGVSRPDIASGVSLDFEDRTNSYTTDSTTSAIHSTHIPPAGPDVNVQTAHVDASTAEPLSTHCSAPDLPTLTLRLCANETALVHTSSPSGTNTSAPAAQATAGQQAPVNTAFTSNPCTTDQATSQSTCAGSTTKNSMLAQVAAALEDALVLDVAPEAWRVSRTLRDQVPCLYGTVGVPQPTAGRAIYSFPVELVDDGETPQLSAIPSDDEDQGLEEHGLYDSPTSESSGYPSSSEHEESDQRHSTVARRLFNAADFASLGQRFASSSSISSSTSISSGPPSSSSCDSASAAAYRKARRQPFAGAAKVPRGALDQGLLRWACMSDVGDATPRNTAGWRKQRRLKVRMCSLWDLLLLLQPFRYSRPVGGIEMPQRAPSMPDMHALGAALSRRSSLTQSEAPLNDLDVADYIMSADSYAHLDHLSGTMSSGSDAQDDSLPVHSDQRGILAAEDTPYSGNPYLTAFASLSADGISDVVDGPGLAAAFCEPSAFLLPRAHSLSTIMELDEIPSPPSWEGLYGRVNSDLAKIDLDALPLI